MTYCIDCANIRYPGWFGPPRCSVKRMSWVNPTDTNEMLPCVAANDGNCEKYEAARKPRQGKLFKEE